METKTPRLHHAPFVGYFACFVSGILIDQHAESITLRHWIAILAILIPCFLLTKVIKSQQWQTFRIKSLAYYALLIAIGGLHAAVCKQEKPELAPTSKADFSGIVLDQPTVGQHFDKLIVQLDRVKFGDTIEYINETILLYSADSAQNQIIKPGMRLFFKATLSSIKNNGNPASFDYKRYMGQKGIRYQAYIHNNLTVTNEKVRSLKIHALLARQKLIDQYKKHSITGDRLAVLSALTLGDRTYLSPDLKSSFSSSGAMHILAVSGLHVGIICIMISKFLGFLFPLKKNSLPKALAVVLFLWVYAFITGLSASVMRSATMFTFLELGNAGHRKGNIYNTLAISAIILLLVRPNALFEVGFQLSYAAVAGIVYFQPKITSLFTPKNWILNAIWGLFTVSVAAQLSTTPLSLYYFHQFPIYFWVTNLIVVPISGLILYLSALFFTLSFFPKIAGLVGIILNLTVTGLNFTVRTIESLPGSVIDQVWISGFTLAGLYLLMRAAVPSLTNGSIRHFRLSILLTIALMVNSCLVYYRSSTQQKIIIYNLGQKNLISYLHGREHYYYSTKKEDLSIFEHNMVVNVSGKYHTSKPQWCDNLGILCPCIRYSNPYLILNGLVIEFASLPEISKKGPATDLRYDVKRGKVYYSALMHEKQVNKSFQETPSNDPNFAYLHDLKKDGAMIIDF